EKVQAWFTAQKPEEAQAKKSKTGKISAGFKKIIEKLDDLEKKQPKDLAVYRTTYLTLLRLEAMKEMGPIFVGLLLETLLHPMSLLRAGLGTFTGNRSTG